MPRPEDLHLFPFRLPAARSPAWVIAETATSALFSFFSLMLIGRVIGPDAAGIGAVAMAAFLLLDVAGGSLFTDALVQRREMTPVHAASAVTAQSLAGLLGGLVLAALGPTLAREAEAPDILPLTLALAGLLPLSAFSGAVAGLVLRQQRYRLMALRAMLGLPVGLTAGLLLAHAGAGPWAMVAYQAGATVSVFLLMAFGARQRLRPMLSRQALTALWPVAGPQVLAIVVQAGRYRIFVIVLGMLTAEAVVAICNVAFRLLDSALGMVWGSVHRLAMPRFSALQRDRAALAEAYGDIAQLQALMGMPIAAGVALTAPDLVHALLGPAWAAAADAARVVGWVGVASFAWGDASSLFVALGKTRRNLIVAAWSLLVPLAALLAARPATPIGVAWCWAASTLAIGPVLAWLALSEIRRSPLWLLRRLLPAVLATAVMTLAVMLTRSEINGAPLQALVAAAATGAAVFGAVAWAALGGRTPRALQHAVVAAE
ncbi:MAG TPA: oligosaccharide flippase family protein [Crenalkalicoccus sp.]|nr:oligosaccharide flippase family protein [Crenalkalicoccus sp.]